MTHKIKIKNKRILSITCFHVNLDARCVAKEKTQKREHEIHRYDVRAKNPQIR
jgi:S-ribosylhomocysteine lyase LuxS involved in autoinducer biosynthesis